GFDAVFAAVALEVIDELLARDLAAHAVVAIVPARGVVAALERLTALEHTARSATVAVAVVLHHLVDTVSELLLDVLEPGSEAADEAAGQLGAALRVLRAVEALAVGVPHHVLEVLELRRALGKLVRRIAQLRAVLAHALFLAFTAADHQQHDGQ